MLGVNVAIVNPAVPNKSVYVRLQIKDDDGDDDGLRLGKSKDVELQTVANSNKYSVSGGGQHIPFKDVHDRLKSLYDSDKETSLYKAQSDFVKAEDLDSGVSPRLTRARSILPSNEQTIGETKLFNDTWSLNTRPVLELQNALENSESHCISLKHKLMEAQSVLELQRDHLKDIELAAIDNSMIVNDLKFKEMECHKVIDNFEATVKDKQQLQIANLQLREDIQERLNALDYQLRIFRELHHGRECIDKHTFYKHTANALSLLEEDKKKLEKDNIALLKKVQEMAYEISELRSLLQSTRDINESLSANWNASTEANRELRIELVSLKGSYMQALEQVAALEHARRAWRSQQDLTEQDRFRLQAEIDRLTEENIRLSQAIRNMYTKADCDKLEDELRKLHAENINLKHEYDLLNSKHQNFLISYINDGEVAKKDKQEMDAVRKDNAVLMKQVALLQSQLSLLENSKKKAEEQIYKLTSELGEVNAQMKQNSNSFRDQSAALERSLRQEIDILKQQLGKAKDKELLQEEMLKKIKKESMEYTNSELQHMKSKLNELLQEIEYKKQIIEKLESEIRSANAAMKEKQSDVQELQKTLKRMEGENQTLLQDVQAIRNALETELLQKQEQLTLKRSTSAKSLQEELIKAERSEKYGTYGQSSDALLSKSLVMRSVSGPDLSTEPGKTQRKGQYGTLFFDLPKKSEGNDSNRLQSLVSKYRSHSENEMANTQLATSPKLGMKNRGSNATSKERHYGLSLAPENAMSGPAKQERGSFTSTSFSKSAKNVPKSLPPTPASNLFSSTKSSFMRAGSSDDNRNENTSRPGMTLLSSSTKRSLPSVVVGKHSSG